MKNNTINSLAGTFYMLEDEFVKFDPNEGKESSNQKEGDNEEDKDKHVNPIEYFEIQATKKMDYIGFNNIYEKEFLAFSKYYSMREGKQILDYLDRNKLQTSDSG